MMKKALCLVLMLLMMQSVYAAVYKGPVKTDTLEVRPSEMTDGGVVPGDPIGGSSGTSSSGGTTYDPSKPGKYPILNTVTGGIQGYNDISEWKDGTRTITYYAGGEFKDGKPTGGYKGYTVTQVQSSANKNQWVTLDKNGKVVSYYDGKNIYGKDTPGSVSGLDTFNNENPTITVQGSTFKYETEKDGKTTTYTGGSAYYTLKYDPATKTYKQTGEIEYKGADGKVIGGIDDNGYAFTIDKDGKRDTTTSQYLADAIEEDTMRKIAKEKGWPTKADGSVDEDKLTDEQEKEYDELRDGVEENAEAEARKLQKQSESTSFCQNFFSCAGKILKVYEQYKGVGEVFAAFIPGYGKYVNRVREELTRSFCLASGVQNCLISTICGSMIDMDTSTMLIARGPGGQLITSGTISAERSLPINLEGLQAQTLKDIFNSETAVIEGKFYNFSDPKFDPKQLKFTLRLYHFRMQIQNNVAEGKEMKYNVAFVGTDRTAKWYPKDETLDYGGQKIIDKYKFSTAKYDKICMTFDPKLPTGNNLVIRPKFVDKLCRPIVEYQGGPTSIEGREEGATQGKTEQGLPEGANV